MNRVEMPNVLDWVRHRSGVWNYKRRGVKYREGFCVREGWAGLWIAVVHGGESSDHLTLREAKATVVRRIASR